MRYFLQHLYAFSFKQVVLLCLFAVVTHAAPQHNEGIVNQVQIPVTDFSSKTVGEERYKNITDLITDIEVKAKDINADPTLELTSLFVQLKLAWQECNDACKKSFASTGVDSDFSLIYAFTNSSNVKMTDRVRREIASFFNAKLSKSKTVQELLNKMKKENSKQLTDSSFLYNEWIQRLDSVKDEAKKWGLPEQEYLLFIEEENLNSDQIYKKLLHDGYAPLQKNDTVSIYNHALESVKANTPLAIDTHTSFNSNMVRYLADEKFTSQASTPEKLNSNMREFVDTLARIISIKQGADGSTIFEKKTGQDAIAALKELHDKWGKYLDDIVRTWNGVPLEVSESNPWGLRIPNFGWAVFSAISEQNADGSLRISTIDEDQNGHVPTPESGTAPSVGGTSPTVPSPSIASNTPPSPPHSPSTDIRGPEDLGRFFSNKDNPYGDRLSRHQGFRFAPPPIIDSTVPSVADSDTDNSASPIIDRPELSHFGSHERHERHNRRDNISYNDGNELKPQGKKEVSFGNKANEITADKKMGLSSLKSNSQNYKKNLDFVPKLTSSPSSSVERAQIQENNTLPVSGKVLNPTTVGSGFFSNLAPAFNPTLIDNNKFFEKVKEPVKAPVERRYDSKNRAIVDKFAYSSAEKGRASSKEKRTEVSTASSESFDSNNLVFTIKNMKKTIGENTKVVFDETEEIIVKSQDKKINLKEITKKITFGANNTIEEKTQEFDPKTGQKTHLTTLYKVQNDSGRILELKKIEVWFSANLPQTIEKMVTTIETSLGKNPLRTVVTEVFDPSTGKSIKKSTDEFSLVAQAAN